MSLCCPACGEPGAAVLEWGVLDEHGRERYRCGCGEVFAVEPEPPTLDELKRRHDSARQRLALQIRWLRDLERRCRFARHLVEHRVAGK